jgi:SAM-dependent methyltransferase
MALDGVREIDRSKLFQNLSEERILENYRKNYGIVSVSIDQVRRHAELEGELTDKIVLSSSSDRARIVSDAYSTLYREINWLTGTGGQHDGNVWLSLMYVGAEVYEIGSGSGKLANYLNENGVKCTRTDISAERNSVNGVGGAEVTDGVNLSKFTDAKYDFVISDQVVEHLHPDDIVKHFSESRKILKKGGRYIFRAPNRFLGPCDLSRVFEEKQAIFMHLHEFSWEDVRGIEGNCKYRNVSAIFKIPKTRVFFKSRLYYKYLLFIEYFLRKYPRIVKYSKFLYYPPQVWVSLEN